LTAPAGVWPLVTALQAIGSRIPRSNSWQAELVPDMARWDAHLQLEGPYRDVTET
jgi:hypothetical protein